MIFVLLLLVPFFAPLMLGGAATREQQALPSGQDIGGAVSAARGTFEYMSGICDERPDVCQDGSGIIGFLGHRARQGAEIVYLYLGQHFGDKAPQPAQETAAAPKVARPAAPDPVTVADPPPAVIAGDTPDLIQTGAIIGQPVKVQPPIRIPGLPENVPVPTPRPR
ncbi:DUF5330 domain-containing protein [Martelella soudanensis]|uniref:DUF5330 domain-containing protein n=1 Tax=unclassified Martelella TaxID=2629616 RepID=UPI0015DEA454|nr:MULTISPECIES: DUF5330 domain-containing protein [unclassified Martelella]